MNSRRQKPPVWRDPTILMMLCCILYGVAWGILLAAVVASWWGWV